jgi:hypothetical protein
MKVRYSSVDNLINNWNSDKTGTKYTQCEDFTSE